MPRNFIQASLRTLSDMAEDASETLGQFADATRGSKRRILPALLDGYTRDTPKVIEQNFPVFCSGTWAQDSSVRTYVFKWRCPIEIGQVTIHNGDIVFGDIDGVLIIPKDIAPEVIEKALVKASTEKTMRKAIEDGMMVTDAFAKFGVL